MTDQTSQQVFPPLPEPEGTIHSDGYWIAHKNPYPGKFGAVYSADMMHEYARAAIKHAQQAAESEREKALTGWKLFGANVLDCARDGMGDVCGGDIQDWAVEAGLLIEHQVTESCGENCACAEYGDFPHKCYRYSTEASAAIASIRGQQPAQADKELP